MTRGTGKTGDWTDLLDRDLADALMATLREVYAAERPHPLASDEVPAIPDRGLGESALPALWDRIAAESAKLASPWMMGHMDTAPHPAAVLTDALVSALNNNLLFRELSPFASAVEERLIEDLAGALVLPAATPGLFCSGGSLANLTALFAALGGYHRTQGRGEAVIAMPEGAHSSIAKAAAILGLAPENLRAVPTDPAGRMDLEALDTLLKGATEGQKIVVGVLGGTVTGSVDDLNGIAEVCARHGAWFHVDAVYGGALAFSKRHRGFLAGLSKAESIAVGPQKWFYVPRLCALVLFPGLEDFDRRLGVVMPYSAGDRPHRGTWGLQGSRRADAVTLWALLQVLGRETLGGLVDGSIDLARHFNALLRDHPLAEPVHEPDLNLQAFRFGPPDHDGTRLLALQRGLEQQGRAWLSVSRWRGEFVFRSVLLNPGTGEDHLRALLDDLTSLSSRPPPG